MSPRRRTLVGEKATIQVVIPWPNYTSSTSTTVRPDSRLFTVRLGLFAFLTFWTHSGSQSPRCRQAALVEILVYSRPSFFAHLSLRFPSWLISYRPVYRSVDAVCRDPSQIPFRLLGDISEARSPSPSCAVAPNPLLPHHPPFTSSAWALLVRLILHNTSSLIGDRKLYIRSDGGHVSFHSRI